MTLHFQRLKFNSKKTKLLIYLSLKDLTSKHWSIADGSHADKIKLYTRLMRQLRNVSQNYIFSSADFKLETVFNETAD